MQSDVEARLLGLERDNRRLRFALGGIVLFGIVVAVSGQVGNEQLRTLKTSRVEVVDERGVVRVAIGIDETRKQMDEFGLFVFNTDGSNPVRLAAANSPRIAALCLKNGKLSVSAGAGSVNGDDFVDLGIDGPSGKVSLSSSGMATSLQLERTMEASELALYLKGYDKLSDAEKAIMNDRQRRRVAISLSLFDGAPSAEIHNRDGNTIWHAP